MSTKTTEKALTISAPNLQTAEFRILGTAPYVQLRFSEKAINQMKAKMEAGSQAKKSKAREARDFDADYQSAFHRPTNGGFGIPASAFRAAMISACRLIGFKMTLAKLTVFIEADDIDSIDGMPLVYIKGEPEKCEHFVRNATGVADIRVRAMWRKWSAVLRITFDNDIFSLQDVTNLISRVGAQVGIGEGRPDGKASAGMGWGTFRLAQSEDDNG